MKSTIITLLAYLAVFISLPCVAENVTPSEDCLTLRKMGDKFVADAPPPTSKVGFITNEAKKYLSDPALQKALDERGVAKTVTTITQASRKQEGLFTNTYVIRKYDTLVCDPVTSIVHLGNSVVETEKDGFSVCLIWIYLFGLVILTTQLIKYRNKTFPDPSQFWNFPFFWNFPLLGFMITTSVSGALLFSLPMIGVPLFLASISAWGGLAFCKPKGAPQKVCYTLFSISIILGGLSLAGVFS